MIENKYSAIVIKSFTPALHRVILLDVKDGKCIGFSPKKHLSNGSVIQYQIVHTYKDTRRIVPQVLMVPTYCSEDDQLFFHHILELCNYFIPIGYKDEPLYEFLRLLCDQWYQDGTNRINKGLLLLTLCKLLGIYPQDAFFHTPFYYQLVGIPIHKMQDKQISDNKLLTKLYNWIYSCIMQHPFVAEFKTVHFLTGGRKS